ncbi:MAG: hypothetical protein IPJ77_07405 [Planctomycetes bacterium]|nr:hypothetical protein [Planctomycetota bacterium]
MARVEEARIDEAAIEAENVWLPPEPDEGRGREAVSENGVLGRSAEFPKEAITTEAPLGDGAE